MRLRVGYQLSITALFVAVVLTIGLALIGLSFDRARAITRRAALAYIDRVAAHTVDRIDTLFRSVLSDLEVLRQLPAVVDAEIADNPRFYGTLAALLRQHTQLYNLYVGYDDGRFLELDLLDRGGPALREKLGAPAAAAFRLTVIDQPSDAPARLRHTYFLAPDLRTIARKQRPADYDPRERPWYRGAFDPGARTITDPYVFGNAVLTGYTVRAPFTEPRRGIVAGDILLAEADAFLREQKLGQSGVVFLFDDRGRVVAHPQMSEFLHARAPGVPVELPRLEQLEAVDIARPLTLWRQGGAARQLFDAGDGRTYVASFRSIDSAGAASLRLAVMAPLEEFFAEVEAGRREMVLLAVGFVLVALPVVWWVGSRLSRSMKFLAAETDRIQHFEVGDDVGRVRSAIREIDDLGRSVSTMRAVVQTFSSFIPRRLVQQLVESGSALRLGGARREITVLFSDIAGFTDITERADPEQVMVRTSRYFAVLTDAIVAHRGTVDKFVGDAVMAIWNAPADDPDHVANACRAVLACREANRQLNAEFRREGWPAYRTRFGLHAGEAVVGIIGSADRMAYTALGATVNLAARLEPLNKDFGTEILVSEAVRSRVADAFAFRAVATVRPKGFASAVQVHELCRAFAPQDGAAVAARG